MNFITGLIIGLVIGSVLSFIGYAFIMSSAKLNREHEAYREGYFDGINAKKDKIGE